MILLHQEPFGVASYHKRIYPEQAEERLAQGLVVPVEISFETWLSGKFLEAEAFLDPGADNTCISLRWLVEEAEALGSSGILPLLTPTGYFTEAISISIGGYRLALGDSDRPVWMGVQEGITESGLEMPGCEDLLLGRDFLTQHGLVLLVDGGSSNFSLLLPADADNVQRREYAQQAFDPSWQLG